MGYGLVVGCQPVPLSEAVEVGSVGAADDLVEGVVLEHEDQDVARLASSRRGWELGAGRGLRSAGRSKRGRGLRRRRGLRRG